MSNQINLQNLWERMSPEQRVKYADRFKQADASHAQSYNFGPPAIPAVKPRYQPTPPPTGTSTSTSTPPTGSVPKADDKKDKKDDKKGELSDKDIEKDFKSFLSNIPKTYSDRVKTVNLDKLDQATMDKAKMVKAGDLYYKTNDIEQAKGYLEQNNIDYKIDESLSTPDHLVLVNNQDATDVRIATRGTDVKNINDLRTDVDILMGRQNKNSTFKVAKEFAQKVKAAYPEAEVIDALGFSLGGAKSIHMSNEVPGVKSTTFNPYLVHESADTGDHTIFRTKDDLPSFISGSLRDNGNIQINTVNSLDPNSYWQKSHHDLKNFFSNKPETDASGKPKKDQLQRPMTPEERAEAISQFEDPPPGDITSEFVDTSLSDDPLFQDPRGLPNSDQNFQGLNSDVGTEPKPKFDQKAFEKYRDNFRDTWGTDEEQISDEGLEQMYRDSLESSPPPVGTSGDSSSPPPAGEPAPTGGGEDVARPVGDPFEDAETRFAQHHMKNLNRHAQADTFVNDVMPNLEDGLSYSEHVHKTNMMSDGKFGIDTLVDPVSGDISLNMETGRMGRHSLFYKLWKQGGGKFTDEEEKYFDKFGDADESIGQDSLLSDDEVAAMVEEGSKDGPTYTKIKSDMEASNDALNGVTI